ncbi:VOC family protein [Brooklawnia sp.]|uniref:VOC family protein n=1 Tax=Brooklawnia sp. TaxID=2699740 RepID=UPI00311F6F47
MTSKNSRLDHAALVVASLDRSTAFYSSLLGLEVRNRVELSDHTIQYLDSGTEVLLELIAYQAGAAGQPLSAPGLPAAHHLAWQVPDANELRPRIIALGGSIVSMPVFMPELQQTSMLIQDPDGFLIELVEK